MVICITFTSFLTYNHHRPDKIRQEKHRRCQKDNPEPVGDTQTGNIECRTGEGDNQNLTQNDDKGNPDESTAKGTLDLGRVAEAVNNVEDKTTVGMEILGIKEVPELHHHKECEEESHILTTHM